ADIGVDPVARIDVGGDGAVRHIGVDNAAATTAEADLGGIVEEIDLHAVIVVDVQKPAQLGGGGRSGKAGHEQGRRGYSDKFAHFYLHAFTRGRPGEGREAATGHPDAECVRRPDMEVATYRRSKLITPPAVPFGVSHWLNDG